MSSCAVGWPFVKVKRQGGEGVGAARNGCTIGEVSRPNAVRRPVLIVLASWLRFIARYALQRGVEVVKPALALPTAFVSHVKPVLALPNCQMVRNLKTSLAITARTASLIE